MGVNLYTPPVAPLKGMMGAFSLRKFLEPYTLQSLLKQGGVGVSPRNFWKFGKKDTKSDVLAMYIYHRFWLVSASGQ